jgi:hypothetical protein
MGTRMIVVVDCLGVDGPQLDSIRRLARFGLVSRRLGLEVCLRNANGELRDLLEFLGLDQVLPREPAGLTAPHRVIEFSDRGWSVDVPPYMWRRSEDRP